MKPTLALAIACLAPLAAAAQAPQYGCDSPESHQLDFWVGDWDLTYTEDGKTATSRNHVTKILDGCGVAEAFEGAPGTPLVGRSFSTFDRLTKRWKQAWIDNTGTYLDFTGGLEQGRMVFSREAERNGQRFHQRMTFDDVKAESFVWRWQRSDDGGRTWRTLWEIAYRRRG